MELVSGFVSLAMVIIGIIVAVWIQAYIIRLIFMAFSDIGSGGGGHQAPTPEPLMIRALPARRTLAPVYALVGVPA